MRLPVVMCVRCMDPETKTPTGWDPEATGDTPKDWCRSCLGYKGIINLAWRPTKSSRPRRLTPSNVLMLRMLGCVLSDYPAADSEAWAEWVKSYNLSFKERIAKKKAEKADPSLDLPPGAPTQHDGPVEAEPEADTPAEQEAPVP